MRWFRRKYARLNEPFPEEWRALIARNVAHWAYLDADERERLEDMVLWLVVDKRWEGARGFALTDEVRLTIAAQAALLVLGFDDDYDYYENVQTIIVHPSVMTMTGERPGPVDGTVVDGAYDVLGVAHYDGPVLIAWDQARRSGRHPARGHNVVYHEFAHKLDMLDGVIDGTPPIETDDAMRRFVDVCTREYDALQHTVHDILFDSYAATDPAEFFAVATEVFFDQPIEFETHKPELYDVLRVFYRQDPAARTRRYS